MNYYGNKLGLTDHLDFRNNTDQWNLQQKMTILGFDTDLEYLWIPFSDLCLHLSKLDNKFYVSTKDSSSWTSAGLASRISGIMERQFGHLLEPQLLARRPGPRFLTS